MAQKIRMKTFLFVLIFSAFTAQAADLSHQDLEKIIRQKLTQVSLEQANQLSGHWDVSQRDCAGFIRFVYKEAVGSTSMMWINQKGVLTSYLSAQELFSFNFDYLSHDLNDDHIETGDLMVFSLPNNGEDNWHLILLLKSPPGAPQKILAMYHNGEKGKKALLKRVWAQDFLSAEHGPWSARKDNANFLGIFRWKGWKAIAQNKNWQWFLDKKVSLK
jgi:uncharacterized protein YfaT (DUF1175 family)